MSDVVKVFENETILEQYMNSKPELDCWKAVCWLMQLGARYRNRKNKTPPFIAERVALAERLYERRFGIWLPF